MSNHDSGKARNYAIIASFTFLEFGYLISNVSVGLNTFSGWFNMEQPWATITVDTQKSFALYFACFAFFAALGALCGEQVSRSWGKVKTLWWGDAIFFFGTVMTLVEQLEFFFFGRCIQGLALGINIVATAGYINALIPDKSRGSTGAAMMIAFGLGVLFEYITGYASPYMNTNEWKAHEGWRLCFGMWLLWPFARMLALWFWETDKCPDDLIAAGKNAKALKQIEKCHKSGAQERLNYLIALNSTKQTYKSLFKDYKPILNCGTVLVLAWNFTGLPYMFSWTQMLYNVSLYPYSGSVIYGTKTVDYALPQNYCVLFAGLVFVSAIIGWFLVDKLGRKLLTLIGLAVCAIMMMIVCILGYRNEESTTGKYMGNLDNHGTVTCYCIWAAAFGLFSSGAWAWLQDALPRKAWGPMMAKFFLICFILQLTAYDVWFSRKTEIDNTIPNGTKLMGLYCAVVSFVCCIGLAVLMKETKGRSQAEILSDYGVKNSKVGGEHHGTVETDRGVLAEAKPQQP